MSLPSSAAFDLGSWRVEPQLHQLARGPGEGKEATKHVTPKTMEVLLCLVDHVGQVVTRQTLLDAVWPRAHIGEEVITRTISDLRSALEDDRKAPRYIETIPKVGYRLIARVERPGAGGLDAPERSNAEEDAGAPGPAAHDRRPSPRVGVLVFAAALAAILLGLGMSLRFDVERPAPAAPLSAVPVTSFPGFESTAEVSPDGRSVVYSRSDPGTGSGSATADEPRGADLYVQSVDGGEPRQLTRDPAYDFGATWSPDGLRLAFGRYSREDGAVGVRCTLLEIPAAGGPERVLGSCGNNATADFAWSPSGEWIAFSDRRSGDVTFGIYLLSTVNGESRLLVAPDEPHWGDRDPHFSPDGRQVAFTRSLSMNTQDVFRIAVAGGEPVPVTTDGRSIRGHAWLPDGSGLVVSSRRSGSRGLWRFPIDGGSPSWLPIAVDHSWNPTLGRSGGPLVFERRLLEAGLRSRALVAESEPVALLESTRQDRDPQLSPDGRRIAFASNRSGHFEIWSASADGSGPTQLTAMNGAYTGAPRWSPDSGEIVFDARLDGQADVYRMRPGEEPERLTVDPANDLAASYSPDGRFIYFGSNRTGEWQIWRRPVDAETLEQVTAGGGYEALIAAGGETLYCSRFGEDGLFRVELASVALPVRGGERVTGTESLAGHGYWTLVGETLYWLARSDGRWMLLRRRPGGDPEQALELGAIDLMPGLSVSAREDALIYAELVHLEADLWRVDAATALD